MSNNIVEENPAQQKSNAPQGQGAGGGQDKVRKQARQLAYDVRYKVKQGFKDGQKTDPASLKSAYISQLGRSPAPGPVKQLAKKMLIGEAYDFVDVNENVSKNISNIIAKVFTKTTQIDDVEGKPAYEITDVVQEDSAVRKYKVRVTDKKSGKSYTRMADRAKISELRKNPNISSVEMTGYGTPYEGEKKKGSQTASVKSGKGLAKKDYDGDGKVESPTAEYKGSKDKAIKKALHREEFIDEVNTEDDNPQANTKRIDVMKGKNKVKVMPNMGEQNELAPAKPEPDAKEKRVGLMKRMILQKKMQAVRSGAGADIVAHNELEGDVISEKEVKVKDTKKVVDAIRAYDKSKDASKDADWDTEHGEKEKGDIEKKYAKKERGEIDKDDPNWKKKKYHTGMHGESYDKEPPIRDQDDQQIANVTFDGGGPDGGATIQGSGDPREIPTFVSLIKNKMRARGILVNHNELEGDTIEESEKLAQKAYDRAQKLGAKRRSSSNPRGIGKSERAGYNLAQSQRSRNVSGETQGGSQTGGGPKSFGYAKHKSNPVKSKSTGDTGQVGHARKRDEKTSVGKSGKQLKTPKYKLSFKDRQTHHTRSAEVRRDPKQNPKHTANIKKEELSVTDTINQILEGNSK